MPRVVTLQTLAESVEEVVPLSSLFFAAVEHRGVAHAHAMCPYTAGDDPLVPAYGTLCSVSFEMLLSSTCSYCNGSASREIANHVQKLLRTALQLVLLKRAALTEFAPFQMEWAKWLSTATPTSTFSAQAVQSMLEVATEYAPHSLPESGALALQRRADLEGSSDVRCLLSAVRHDASGLSLLLSDIQDLPFEAVIVAEHITVQAARQAAPIVMALLADQNTSISPTDALKAALALS